MSWRGGRLDGDAPANHRIVDALGAAEVADRHLGRVDADAHGKEQILAGGIQVGGLRQDLLLSTAIQATPINVAGLG